MMGKVEGVQIRVNDPASFKVGQTITFGVRKHRIKMIVGDWLYLEPVWPGWVYWVASYGVALGCLGLIVWLVFGFWRR